MAHQLLLLYLCTHSLALSWAGLEGVVSAGAGSRPPPSFPRPERLTHVASLAIPLHLVDSSPLWVVGWLLPGAERHGEVEAVRTGDCILG